MIVILDVLSKGLSSIAGILGILSHSSFTKLILTAITVTYCCNLNLQSILSNSQSVGERKSVRFTKNSIYKKFELQKVRITEA